MKLLAYLILGMSLGATAGLAEEGKTILLIGHKPDHPPKCPERTVPCPKQDCPWKGKIYHVEAHLRDECIMRPLPCAHCGELFSPKDRREIHERFLCPLRMVDCKLGCGERVRESEREAHQREKRLTEMGAQSGDESDGSVKKVASKKKTKRKRRKQIRIARFEDSFDDGGDAAEVSKISAVRERLYRLGCCTALQRQRDAGDKDGDDKGAPHVPRRAPCGLAVQQRHQPRT